MQYFVKTNIILFLLSAQSVNSSTISKYQLGDSHMRLAASTFSRIIQFAARARVTREQLIVDLGARGIHDQWAERIADAVEKRSVI